MSRFIYGVNPVLEALRAHPRDVVRVVVEHKKGEKVAQAARDAGVRVDVISTQELGHRAHGGVHQGVGAELAEFEYAEPEEILAAAKAKDEPAFVLVLDGVTDPQNFGALVRSAHALGAHGVIVPKDRAAGVTPAAAKAAAGALEHTLVARVTNLSRAIDDLKEAGVWTVALAGDAGRDLASIDLKTPVALVLGNEGAGVRPLVRKTCDHAARIRLAGFESLNVSAAGAIALYEVARQRAKSSA